MRVLFVINGFDPGGAEHGLLTLVENGAFEDHELQSARLLPRPRRSRGRVAARLGKRVQFVTNGDTLTLWACSAGFFSILRTAFSFRPQKMVLSLKQANVVGRSAAMLMPRLTCVAFEHIGGVPCAPVPGALRTAPAPALHARRRGVGRLRGDARRDAPLFPSSPPRRTRDPALRRGETRRPSRPTMRWDPACGLLLPEGSSRARTWR